MTAELLNDFSEDTESLPIGGGTLTGDLTLASTNPVLRISDTRNLGNGSYEDVSLGSLQFHTTDTTSPGEHVGAEIQAWANTQSASAPNFSLIFKTADNTEAAVERMRLDENGKLGVGTSSPSGLLDLTTTGSTSLDIQGGDGNSKNIKFRKTTGGAQQAKISVVGDDLRFTTGTTSERMRIDSAGKVLIGDSSSHTTDLLQIETPASGGGHGIQIRRNDSNTDQNVGHILFGNNTATDLASISAKTDGATDSGAILFNTSVASGANTERLRIDSSGIIKFASTTNYGNSASYPTYPTAVGGYIHSYVNGSGTTYPRFLDIVCVGEGDGSKGGNIRFLTSPNGSTAAAERMRIESDGRIKTTECVYTYSGVQVSAAASTNYTLISGVPIGTYLLTVEGTGVYHYGGLFMYRHFDSGDKVITEIGHSDYQTTMTVTNTSNTYNSGNVIVNSNRALGNLTARLTIMGN
ncbi:MAG: hypothetical protein HOM18_04990 [Candidatus Marinimicrobia bacterium]|nr:hypothetical protein [Candidatus Neomarinimicrobiota bacterium]